MYYTFNLHIFIFQIASSWHRILAGGKFSWNWKLSQLFKIEKVLKSCCLDFSYHVSRIVCLPKYSSKDGRQNRMASIFPPKLSNFSILYLAFSFRGEEYFWCNICYYFSFCLRCSIRCMRLVPAPGPAFIYPSVNCGYREMMRRPGHSSVTTRHRQRHRPADYFDAFYTW